jgi:DNA polymerase-3 subunit epsilon
MAEGAAMLDQLKLAIVDVETTGAGITGDRVIEIGVRRIERGRVARTFESLIDPGQRIPSFIERLTGIRNEFLRLGRSFTTPYNLSELIERFRLPCRRRHRALGDAEAVWAFLQVAHRQAGPDRFAAAVTALLRRPNNRTVPIPPVLRSTTPAIRAPLDRNQPIWQLHMEG